MQDTMNDEETKTLYFIYLLFKESEEFRSFINGSVSLYKQAILSGRSKELYKNLIDLVDRMGFK